MIARAPDTAKHARMIDSTHRELDHFRQRFSGSPTVKDLWLLVHTQLKPRLHRHAAHNSDNKAVDHFRRHFPAQHTAASDVHTSVETLHTRAVALLSRKEYLITGTEQPDQIKPLRESDRQEILSLMNDHLEQ